MPDLKKLLKDEAEHAEKHKDAKPSKDTTVVRPGRDRAKVLSIRLNQSEYDELVGHAETAGVGASTFARSLILSALAGASETGDQTLETVLHRLDALEARVAANS